MKTFAAIAVVALCTCATRALPFLIFRQNELPPVVRRLGQTLPPAIMAILVVYCLRDVRFAAEPGAWAGLLAAGAVAIVQAMSKKMYLSIVLGTAVYMLLTNLPFA